MLRKIRITFALVFFIGVTMLFLDFTGTLHHWLGWMAEIQLLPAVLALNLVVIVALALLTLVFGRIYCSVICPLGVMQDVIARVRKIGKRNPYTYSKGINWLRYAMLILFVALALGGMMSFAALIAPYSSYGRIAGNLFLPLYELVNNLFAAIAERVDSYAFYSTDVWIRSLPTFIVALVSFIVIAVMAFLNGRTYCNTICPVGTVLGFLSRFSFYKIKFDSDKCRSCSLCSKNCKASCIDFKTHKVDYSRCVVCGDCIESCKFDALHYVRGGKNDVKASDETAQTVSKQNEHAENTDNGRRSFLLAAALATTTAALAQKDKKVDGGLAEIEDKVAPKRVTPITPPGSLSADNLAKHCTACQLCVSACPNGVLRPSTDLQKFMQPTMSYERGYCRPECTRCSDVCPTGAIRKIDRPEKTAIQIGHAVWVKKNCVAVTDLVECGNCARHCPSGAITMVPYQTPDGEVSIPVVNTSRCIGCGACENLCPARPFSAIYVEGHEVHKKI